MSEWASASEEVGRKALDALQSAMAREDAGELNVREVWLIADALYDTISGINNHAASIILHVRDKLPSPLPRSRKC